MSLAVACSSQSVQWSLLVSLSRSQNLLIAALWATCTGVSGVSQYLYNRLLSLFFSYFKSVSSFVHHLFMKGLGWVVGTSLSKTSFIVLTKRLTIPSNLQMSVVTIHPLTVLLDIVLTSYSYHLISSLSKWTFSHHLWPICLLILFCTLFSDYLSYPSFIYIYQTQSLYITNLFLPLNCNK